MVNNQIHWKKQIIWPYKKLEEASKKYFYEGNYSDWNKHSCHDCV